VDPAEDAALAAAVDETAYPLRGLWAGGGLLCLQDGLQTACLGPDGDDGGRVEAEVPAPRLRVLVQQPVQLPQQLHHPLIARPRCKARSGLSQRRVHCADGS